MDAFECGLAIDGEIDDIPLLGEDLTEGLPHPRFVVDDEDSPFFHEPLSRARA